jgi:hypothetical protein
MRSGVPRLPAKNTWPCGDRRRCRCLPGAAKRVPRRRHANEISALLDQGAELAQFGRHRRDAVGFLDAPAGDVAQVVGPSANRAVVASVIAASGMWLQSSSMPLQLAARGADASIQFGPISMRHPSAPALRQNAHRPESNRGRRLRRAPGRRRWRPAPGNRRRTTHRPRHRPRPGER